MPYPVLQDVIDGMVDAFEVLAEEHFQDCVDANTSMCDLVDQLNVILNPLDPLVCDPVDCTALLLQSCTVSVNADIPGTTCVLFDQVGEDSCTSCVPDHYLAPVADRPCVLGDPLYVYKCDYIPGTPDTCVPTGGYTGLCEATVAFEEEFCLAKDFVPGVCVSGDANLCVYTSLFPAFF